MNKQDNIIIYGVQYPNPDSVHWETEECIDFRLSSIEYRTLLQGYPPDWDCRYAPFQFQDWLYITRSGFWLKKSNTKSKRMVFIIFLDILRQKKDEDIIYCLKSFVMDTLNLHYLKSYKERAY